MAFGEGAYGKIWGIKDMGNYSLVELSTSKKNKKTEKYETDFRCKFVRFIGTAHEKTKDLKGDERIKIGSCEVTNRYDQEKQKEYTNFAVFSFETASGNSPEPEEELPFDN